MFCISPAWYSNIGLTNGVSLGRGHRLIQPIADRWYVWGNLFENIHFTLLLFYTINSK